MTEAIMARKSGRAALVLTQAQAVTLKELSRSRTAPSREAERARVLLGYAGGTSITELLRRLGVGRPMIYKCVHKALAAGVQMGLKRLSTDMSDALLPAAWCGAGGAMAASETLVPRHHAKSKFSVASLPTGKRAPQTIS